MAVAEQRPPAGLDTAMAGDPIFEETPVSDVRALMGDGTIRLYQRDTYLFHQGDRGGEVFFLWRGRVEISSITLSGQRQLHTTLDRPQFFGELGVLGGMNRTATVRALEDTTVWVADGETFLEFLARHPEASRSLLRALARQVHAHEALAEDLLFLDLKGRVAKRLLQLVSPTLDEIPTDGAPVPSIVTHADLASLAGGSRENVTRILSDFQRRKLIAREGRRYVLRDIAGLRRLAGL